MADVKTTDDGEAASSGRFVVQIEKLGYRAATGGMTSPSLAEARRYATEEEAWLHVDLNGWVEEILEDGTLRVIARPPSEMMNP